MKITLENASIGYEGKTVIKSLNLTVESGEFFTLLGQSGCGKTTLLRAIAGFNALQSGSLHFGATNVTELPTHKRNIGMVFQDYALFPDKTVFDNVAYGLRARNLSETTVKQKVLNGLERVGLADFAARKPAALSGGQRQRVALIRALVIEPSVLLMDEPLSNLDAKMRHVMRENIVEMQREAGITCIFVTHDQEEALAMSTRIGVMNNGALEQVDTPQNLYQSPKTKFIAGFLGAANILKEGDKTFSLRPEDITIAKSGTPALLLSKQYLGAKTSYKAKINNQILQIDLSSENHAQFEVGQTVGLVIPQNKKHELAI